MIDAARQRFEESLQLASALGPARVHRGVLQHFFVSPALPQVPLAPEQIGHGWARFAEDVRARRAPELVHLYLHIPFCSRRCRYCVYYSVGAPRPEQVEAYLDRLHAELDFYGAAIEPARVSTCYLGGGTPTVLSPRQLAELLDHLDRRFSRRRGGEWAFECNPLSLTDDKARLFRDHGFNRASFGIQTLNRRVLDRVDRGYQTRRRVAETFRILRRHRFWINVDLIQGLPGESAESMRQSFEEVLRHQPTQVTIYAISPFTPIESVDADQLPPIAETLPRLMPLARRHGYRGSAGATALVFTSRRWLGDNRLDAERRWLGHHHSYDDTTIEPFSLLGLGPTARCYIYGRLRYMLDPVPVDAPFEPGVAGAMGRTVTMDEERRRFVVYRLSHPKGLREFDFVRQFGQRLADAFGAELDAALRLGLLRKAGGAYRHTADDPVVRFATELGFVDEAMVETVRSELAGDRTPEAADSSPSEPGAPEPSSEREGPTLALSSRGIEVSVVLADYWPERPCYHHAGRFALFVPSDLPEGTCTLGVPRERLLRAFCLLFDQVVERAAPQDVVELSSALCDEARGREGLDLVDITHRPPSAVDDP